MKAEDGNSHDEAEHAVAVIQLSLVQPSLLYRDAPRVSPHPHSTYVSTCGSWPRPCHYTTQRLFETRRLLPFFGSSPPATKRGRRLFDAGVYSRKYGMYMHSLMLKHYTLSLDYETREYICVCQNKGPVQVW